VALGGVLAWLAFVPVLRGERDGRIGSRVGEPAPELALTDLDGREWTIADAAADGRLVWVNFWATSCEPCRTEMPAMQRLAEEHPDELLILGANWGEERGSVEDFVERYGVTYPILLDPSLEAYYRWAGTDGLPRHYFIGAEGTVLREIIGPLDPARMVAILDELLPA
jgi:thiol-disulfide isomerase/thioredoxin